MSIATTCQEVDLENPSHGGQIHFFKPSNLFFEDEETALRRLEDAYDDLLEDEKNKINKFI